MHMSSRRAPRASLVGILLHASGWLVIACGAVACGARSDPEPLRPAIVESPLEPTIAGRCYRFPDEFFRPREPTSSLALVGFSPDTALDADRPMRRGQGTVHIFNADSGYRRAPRRPIPTVWWMRGRDSVDVWWGTGFTQITFELGLRGDTLRGLASWNDDIGQSGSKPVVAVRVVCPGSARQRI